MGKTPVLVMEPGISNANGVMVHINVLPSRPLRFDFNLIFNYKINGDIQGLQPKQGLMEDEFIEVLLFPIDSLLTCITGMFLASLLTFLGLKLPSY